MSQRIHFLLQWILLNPIGFMLGSLHGATDNGFIPSVIPGYVGLILGDLIFGGMVGFVQYIVFKRNEFLQISNLWIIANSLGFTFGARTGAFLTFRITDNWMFAGIIFGIFMGGSIGLFTSFVLYKQLSHRRLFIWIVTSMAAWVAGEWIAFASLFTLETVPLVALAIAGITGLGLVYIQSQPQIKTQIQLE